MGYEAVTAAVIVFSAPLRTAFVAADAPRVVSALLDPPAIC